MCHRGRPTDTQRRSVSAQVRYDRPVAGPCYRLPTGPKSLNLANMIRTNTCGRRPAGKQKEGASSAFSVIQIAGLPSTTLDRRPEADVPTLESGNPLLFLSRNRCPHTRCRHRFAQGGTLVTRPSFGGIRPRVEAPRPRARVSRLCAAILHPLGEATRPCAREPHGWAAPRDTCTETKVACTGQSATIFTLVMVTIGPRLRRGDTMSSMAGSGRGALGGARVARSKRREV